MANWSLDFDAPQYLWLLVLLPFFWLVSRRSLHALGTWRRRAALALRMIVATLLILALAEPNWLELAHRLSVLFVVDGSSSIDQTELHDALAYVNKAVATQRDANRGDRAGVVVFGRDAATEVPPLDAPWQISKIESLVDPRFSNLAGALEMAEASFPPDSAKRVVIVSDGNQNVGDANDPGRTNASGRHRHRRRADPLPAPGRRRDPAARRPGEPPQRHAVRPAGRARQHHQQRKRQSRHHRQAPHHPRARRHAADRFRGTRHAPARQAGAHAAAGAQRVGPLDLRSDVHPRRPGRRHPIAEQLRDRLLPGQRQGPRAPRRRCRRTPASSTSVVELLRRNEIEVTVRDTRRPFDNLADLQQFDAVILADVPRVTGDGADEITQFTDEQIRQLVQNTQHFGCGLIVLGGPNSFGAGGWTNTELEKALPVDFQVDNAKVEAVGALVLVIDSSGSMAGEKIAWAKAAAVAAAEMLGRRDYIGVVAFDSEARWIVPLQRNGTASRTRSRIRQLGAGGGTDMMPGLAGGLPGHPRRASLDQARDRAHRRPDDPGRLQPARRQDAQRRHHDQRRRRRPRCRPDAALANIAKAGGGKFYYLLNPKAIPRIFMREARRVSMPLVFEDKDGFAVNVVSPDNELSGIDALPPITGYVLTTIKQNPLVEVLAATPRQPPPNSTIMAAWTYGLGRAAVLTTDVGQRWATTWPAWENYDKLLLQLVRRSMRSHDANEQLAMSTELRDGKIRLVVTALDREDEHLNYLSLSAAAVRPDGTVEEHALEQTAPGRYVATIDAGEPGNYFLSVSGGASTAPLRTAVEVLQTAEFDRLEEQRSTARGLRRPHAHRRRAGLGDRLAQGPCRRGGDAQSERLSPRRRAGGEPQPDLAAGVAGGERDFFGRHFLSPRDDQLRLADERSWRGCRGLAGAQQKRLRRARWTG